jgi:hypothetical protein
MDDDIGASGGQGEDASVAKANGDDDEDEDEANDDDDDADEERDDDFDADFDDNDDESVGNASPIISAVLKGRCSTWGEIEMMVGADPWLLRQRNASGMLPHHEVLSGALEFGEGFSEMPEIVDVFLEHWPESVRERTKVAPAATAETTAHGDTSNKDNNSNNDNDNGELPLHCFCQFLSDGLIVDLKESEVETFTMLVKAWPGSVKQKRPQDEKFPLEIVPPNPAVIRCIEEAWPDAIQEAYANGTILLHRIVERDGPLEAAQLVAGRCPSDVSPRSGQQGRPECAAQNYRIHGR